VLLEGATRDYGFDTDQTLALLNFETLQLEENESVKYPENHLALEHAKTE